MRNENARGHKNDPTDRSTDGPGGPGDSDDSAGADAEKTGCAGQGNPAYEYTHPPDKNRSLNGIPATAVNTVFEALAARLDDGGEIHVRASDLAADLTLGPETVGRALRRLAADDDCPLTVRVWNSNRPYRWYIARPERELVADGGVAPQDLSLFQLEILYTLAEGGPDYGLGIKRSLEGLYGTDINHGQLYPNLDDLVEMGLVDRSQRDRRTNEYALTDSGHALVATDAHRRATVYGQDIAPEDIVPVAPAADGGEWTPEQAALRDGETPDETSHTARNAAQLEALDGDGGGGQ